MGTNPVMFWLVLANIALTGTIAFLMFRLMFQMQFMTMTVERIWSEAKNFFMQDNASTAPLPNAPSTIVVPPDAKIEIKTSTEKSR